MTMEQKDLATTEISQLTTEILILKQQTAQNIIEIGKRLIAVKESLPHGEWGKWLKEKVDFSHSSAKRFMQVAREFSNSPALGVLPPTKVFALLDLPPEEREDFVQNNPVDEMTTRELQKAIKDREKALKEKERLEVKLKAAEKKAQQESEHAKRISESYSRLEETNKGHYQRAEALRKELEDTKKQLSEAQASGDSGLATRLQESLEKTDNELAESYKKIEELERKLKEKPIEVPATTVIEKVPDDVQKELDELRKNHQQNAEVIKFTVCFNVLVKGFQDLLGALAELNNTDPQAHVKYKKAVVGLIGKMSERL